ncbi:hypothetical protein EN742_26730 [Mesorhizobium sp. M4A.F.Ca.ET.020.02.1.1]|uniref:hypothetical protein n=1 Tax=unclassified Mesorhizobium TaxID=325217 RepID=UPI000FD218CB|nr:MULTISPECIES: hypothetical protein [unclassified Mesorhizobium]RVD34712.1 hypothetical protein EN742_26730 [Mesorhizobium sp. M4A.F.Ca.ET.020.02.1.1]RWC20048.1 MAG: hypothetical protein EOS53_11040 [Mesorhizobium sp.]
MTNPDAKPMSLSAMKAAIMSNAPTWDGRTWTAGGRVEAKTKAESAAVYRRDLWKAALRQPAMQSEGAAPNESGHRRDLWKAALQRPLEK